MGVKVSKFGFGGVGFTTKRNTIMPGVQRTWLGGERFIVPALFDASVVDYNYEFGEIVEIVGNDRTNYIVKPISAATTATAKLGVIMQTITGDTTIKGGIITKGLPNVTLEIWLLEENLGGIGVAFKGDAKDVAIGGAVFIGNGTNATVAGAVYGKAITGGTIASKLVFKSLTNAPTETAALSVEIGRL